MFGSVRSWCFLAWILFLLSGHSIYSGGFHIQGIKVHGVWLFYNRASMYHIEWAGGQPETGNYEVNLMMYKPHSFFVHDIPPSGANYGFVCEKTVKPRQQLHSTVWKPCMLV